MAQLTKSRLADVQAILDKSIFGSFNFSIASGSRENEIVIIRFLDDATYYVRMDYENRTIQSSIGGIYTSSRETKRVMVARHSPGDCVEVEDTEIDDFSDFLKVVTEWLTRLRKELPLTRIVDNQLSEFQEFVNRRLDERFTDPQAPFTPDERDEVRTHIAQLQELLAAMSEKIDGHNSELEKLKMELASLSDAAATMPKRTWMRAAYNKAFEVVVMAGTAVGQKVIEETVTKMLPFS